MNLHEFDAVSGAVLLLGIEVTIFIIWWMVTAINKEMNDGDKPVQVHTRKFIPDGEHLSFTVSLLPGYGNYVLGEPVWGKLPEED